MQIRNYGNDTHKVFEVLDRSEIANILSNLDACEVFRKCINLADKYWMSGIAYVYLDARDGSLEEDWIESSSDLHPYDSFYRIILSEEYTPVDWNDVYDEDYIDPQSSEWQEFQKWRTEYDGAAEDFIITKYGQEELDRRRGLIIDDWVSNMEFTDDIEDQLDTLYQRIVSNDIE